MFVFELVGCIVVIGGYVYFGVLVGYGLSVVILLGGYVGVILIGGFGLVVGLCNFYLLLLSLLSEL